MTSNDSMDALRLRSGPAGGDGLEQLLALLPDESRAERTRGRCHAELHLRAARYGGQVRRRQRRAASRTAIAGYAWRVVGPVVVGGVCVLYAAALLATTLRLALR
jgi:hypothetical protein